MRPHPPREYPLSVQTSEDLPLHADWLWRPSNWTTGNVLSGDEVASGVRLFHDDPEADVAFEDGPFLRVRRMDGTFLSLAFDLPRQAIEDLSDWHILDVRVQVDPVDAAPRFARLNLSVGRDTPTWTLAIVDGSAAFDLDRSLPQGRPVSHGWIDLIFDTGGPDRRLLSDVSFARYPRAAM